MTNKSVARRLKLTADLIELTGGNPFRARAFASGARAVERLDVPLDQLVAEGLLTEVQGIGKGLAADIRELISTGELAITERLLQALPPGLPDVLRVHGLGVKKVKTLWNDAGVTSLDELEMAAASGRLAQLDGFGAKTVQNLLASVEELRAYQGQAHLRDAFREAIVLRQALDNAGFRASLAGAVRRQCNVVDAVDLVSTGTAHDVANALVDLGLVVGSTTDEAVVTATPLGVPLTVWLADEATFGRTLFERTASEAHLAAFRDAYGEPAGTSEEDDVYRAVGLSPIPPPLREGTDELALAATSSLPELMTRRDLRGTVHNHTTWSDGAHTLRQMCEGARERGLSYFGVCDHSRSLKIAQGLTIDQLKAQRAEIDAVNTEYGEQGIDFRVFAGSEVDILSDGSMDYPDDVLASLDLVVASVHTGFRMSVDEATARLVQAVSNPYVDILGHPTGRLLLRRKGYPIDAEAVLDACAEHDVAVELNANPWRLDLDWTFLRAATERGVLVSINPDAHAIDGLDDTRWGVASAQKGGLTAAQSLTSKSAHELADWLADRRPAMP
ncbi:MAG: helix-hairpin-helix domain-containing protein [Rubricoccaceae bacterium]